MAELRKEWKDAKKAAEKKGFKLSKVCEDQNFGPLLDEAEKLEEAYEKAVGVDDEKAAKLRVKYKAALSDAYDAGKAYLSALKTIVEKFTSDDPEVMEAAKSLNVKAFNLCNQLLAKNRRVK